MIATGCRQEFVGLGCFVSDLIFETPSSNQRTGMGAADWSVRLRLLNRRKEEFVSCGSTSLRVVRTDYFLKIRKNVCFCRGQSPD